MYDGSAPYDEKNVRFGDRTPDFELLFDLESDPAEIHNLVESHAGSAILATLRQKCAAHSNALNQQRREFQNAVDVQRR